MNQGNKKAQLLFVDDEETFLDHLRTLAEIYGHSWEIQTAASASSALSLLQRHDFDLVVLDMHMPEIDGLQLLKLLQRRFPGLKKAVLTGQANENTRAACLNSGAELVFAKPIDPNSFKTIFSTLDELVSLPVEDGFRGVLKRVGLQEIIQLECLSRHSLIMEVKGGSQAGQIFIKEGSIIHAQVGETGGDQAFYRILSFPSGEFSFKPYADPPQVSIEGQWEFLLMEAARIRDEASENPDSPNQADPIGFTGDQLETAVSLSELAQMPDGKSRDGPRPETDLPPPKIHEFLVCSSQGAVWHEWHCQDANSRILFLEFVSQKSQQMAQGLPLGKFDRVEMQTAGERVAVQIQDDCGIFLRSNQQAPLLAFSRK